MTDNKQTVQEWVHEQRAKFTDAQIEAKLRENNYNDYLISLVMEPPQILPKPVVAPADLIFDPNAFRTVGSAATTPLMAITPKFAEVWQPEKNNTIDLGDAKCRMVLEMLVPRVVVVDDFLSPEECDQLIALSEPAMARSSVIERKTGGNVVDEVRTSSGMFHSRGGSPLVTTIEARISKLIEWPVGHGEGMQILRYEPGEKYEPHNDYFDPNDAGSVVNIGQSGQRIASVLIYLNDPEAGGSTNFPDVGLEVKPRRGSLLFFAYPSHDAHSKTTHGGMPVMQGVKWVAVKWYRINKY